MRKLKRHRAMNGLTMDALEARTGVSKRTISEIERGMRTPHVLTLAKLADALGIDVDELIEEEEAVPKAPAPSRAPDSEDATAAQRELSRGGLRVLLKGAVEQADEAELAAVAALFYELVSKDSGGDGGSDRRELKERLDRAAQAGLDAIGGPEVKS